MSLYNEFNSKHLQDLKQYHFERSNFIEYITKYAPEFIEILWEYGSIPFRTNNFYIFRLEDEFYILHLNSGTLVNWYKHFGRTNTCNKELTLKDLKEFFVKLEIEIKEEML